MEPRWRFLLFLLVFSLGSVLCFWLSKCFAGDRMEESGEIASFLALFWTPLFLAVLLLWAPT